jgi:hypothetical protein
MKTFPLVIIARARKQSDTLSFTERVFGGLDYVLIDLLDYTVVPYNYENIYPEEDEYIAIV